MSPRAFWLIVVLLALGVLLPVLAGALLFGYFYVSSPGDSPWGIGPLWMLLMMLGLVGAISFVVAVVVGFVLLLRWFVDRLDARHAAAPPSALDTLKRRYAQGEIDTPTYEQMRRDLEH